MSKQKSKCTNNIKTEDRSELKSQMIVLEEQFRNACKGFSCKAILDSYYALQNVRKKYYGQTDDRTLEEQVIEDVENSLAHDNDSIFNSNI